MTLKVVISNGVGNLMLMNLEGLIHGILLNFQTVLLSNSFVRSAHEHLGLSYLQSHLLAEYMSWFAHIS